MLSRVVLVDVDVVQRGLLQAEDVDHGPVQDVVGLGEELVEAPTLLLIGLQDVGEHRGQEALKTPERPETTGCHSQLHGYNYHTVSIQCPYDTHVIFMFLVSEPFSDGESMRQTDANV